MTSIFLVITFLIKVIFFSSSSIPISSFELIEATFSINHIIISVLTLFIGIIIAYKLGEK